MKYKISFVGIIISINVIIFVLNSFFQYSKIILALSADVFDGAFYELISYAFVHADLSHLGLNMAMLYAFGSQIERRVGAAKIALVYALSVIVVGLACACVMMLRLRFGGDMYVVLGASGSVCALMGFACHASKEYFRQYLIAILIMSFAPMIVGINIAYDAHIVGFLFGYFLSFFKLLR